MFKRLLAKLFQKEAPPARIPQGHRLFRCFAHGENFPGAMLALPYTIGFYATRYVTAESAEDAEMQALEILRSDPALQLPSGLAKPTEARVYFEKVEEVPGDTPQSPNSGFTFYEMRQEE